MAASRQHLFAWAEAEGIDFDLKREGILHIYRDKQGFDHAAQVVPWAGLRPMMPDMMPRVGAGRRANVFYNTGHGHLGWTLSAVTADMIAGQIAQRRRQLGHQPVPVAASA